MLKYAMLVLKTVFRKHQCCDLKSVFWFGSSFRWARLFESLDRPIETGYTRTSKLFCHSFILSFILSLFFILSSFVADVDIVLYVPFLVSEVFGHIFLNEITVFWVFYPSWFVYPCGVFHPLAQFFHLFGTTVMSHNVIVYAKCVFL